MSTWKSLGGHGGDQRGAMGETRGGPGEDLGGTQGVLVDLEGSSFQENLSFLFTFDQFPHLFLHRLVDSFCCTFLKPFLGPFLIIYNNFTTCLFEHRF